MTETSPATSEEPVRLIVLRHGAIASHKGDVPLTDEGRAQAMAAGRWFARQNLTAIGLLASPTTRTRETAEHFRRGAESVRPDISLPEPQPSFALRNPDLYLGGHHVNMVSSAAAFREQAPSVTEEDVLKAPFYGGFLTDADRIGYWLGHSHPPGDTARAVGTRIEAFTRSLAHVPDWSGRIIVGITHSPVLRAIALTFLGADPGEPPYLHGYRLTLRPGGAISVTPEAPGTSEYPNSDGEPGTAIARAGSA
ncbi:histidine phosphatase family protein [Streptomyces cellulosae]|uniref:histidine phosphatase family protein n=1 Tax=Streptomyces cellulosae TaxID=1968 RepID=UPI0004CA5FA5|nr:histidine phosphatase family protein [Streptomyces cellulosae]